MLLQYSERVALPEYSEVARFNALHADNRARERRMRQSEQEASAGETEQLLARMKAADQRPLLVPGCAPRSKIPVGFRRPEDLKVRLAGAEQLVGQVTEHLGERRVHGAELAEDLRQLGQQLGASAADSSQVHSQICSHLAGILGSGGIPECTLRGELMRALEQHEVCMSRAEEVWRQAELGCARGAGEAELELEQETCARCEEDLTMAARGLCSTAAQAAWDGPEAIAAPSKKCSQDWEAAEPQLVRAAVDRRNVWPLVLKLAASLDSERKAQQALKTVLRGEQTRRNLLDAEIAAPPEARRALAAMRVMACSPREDSEFLS